MTWITKSTKKQLGSTKVYHKGFGFTKRRGEGVGSKMDGFEMRTKVVEEGLGKGLDLRLNIRKNERIVGWVSK